MPNIWINCPPAMSLREFLGFPTQQQIEAKQKRADCRCRTAALIYQLDTLSPQCHRTLWYCSNTLTSELHQATHSPNYPVNDQMLALLDLPHGHPIHVFREICDNSDQLQDALVIKEYCAPRKTTLFINSNTNELEEIEVVDHGQTMIIPRDHREPDFLKQPEVLPNLLATMVDDLKKGRQRWINALQSVRETYCDYLEAQAGPGTAWELQNLLQSVSETTKSKFLVTAPPLSSPDRRKLQNGEPCFNLSITCGVDEEIAMSIKRSLQNKQTSLKQASYYNEGLLPNGGHLILEYRTPYGDPFKFALCHIYQSLPSHWDKIDLTQLAKLEWNFSDFLKGERSFWSDNNVDTPTLLWANPTQTYADQLLFETTFTEEPKSFKKP